MIFVEVILVFRGLVMFWGCLFFFCGGVFWIYGYSYEFGGFLFLGAIFGVVELGVIDEMGVVVVGGYVDSD